MTRRDETRHKVGHEFVLTEYHRPAEEVDIPPPIHTHPPRPTYIRVMGSRRISTGWLVASSRTTTEDDEVSTVDGEIQQLET